MRAERASDQLSYDRSERVGEVAADNDLSNFIL